jgi:hypothetical protein
MTRNQIRVGIVGANAENSWAKVSHVPAIKGIPGFRLAAVATRNERRGREAAQAVGSDRWFSDPFVMIQDVRIDVVTIAVKVPSHRGLAEEMAKAPGSLYTAIGLQGRLNPAVEAFLGPIVEIDARTEILWPAVKLTDTGVESVRETSDHFAVLGTTQSGDVFTAEIYGGVAQQDTRSSFEIRGSDAWLSLTSDHPLRHLVRDLREGTYATPGFDHALHNARLIDRGDKARCRTRRGAQDHNCAGSKSARGASSKCAQWFLTLWWSRRVVFEVCARSGSARWGCLDRVQLCGCQSGFPELKLCSESGCCLQIVRDRRDGAHCQR